MIELFHCSFERLLQLLTSDGENLGIDPCGVTMPPSEQAEWVSSAMSSFNRRYGIAAGMNAKGFPHLV